MPKSPKRTRTVLLVTDRDPVADDVGAALESRGFDVLRCPGPRGPDYSCIGARGGRCPLPVASEAVVVDLDLASDLAPEGTPTLQLLSYYRDLGLPVVALTDSGSSDSVACADANVVVPRSASPEAVVRAIDQVLGRGAAK